jgi:hypothetical protein
MTYAAQWETPLDPGISYAVKVLRDGGVETFESCEGGPGHAFLEPTIRFAGGKGAGFHALARALACGLPVFELRRYWQVIDGEPHGPHWEMTFLPARLTELQRQAEADGFL